MADYIDRNEAIAALTEFRDDQTVSKYVSVENCMVARGAIERATKVLESLPAPDVEPVQQWISVEDRLPEEKVDCIVHYKHAYCDNDDYWAIGMCFYDGEKFQLDPAYKVTHWMPMPQLPKGE